MNKTSRNKPNQGCKTLVLRKLSNVYTQCNSYQDAKDIFHRPRTNISKIYLEPQKAPHTNSDPEKEEQSWRNHAI